MATFPVEHLRPRSERWRLMGVSINGGVSVGGVAPASRTDGGGLWICEQNFLLANTAQRKAGRALQAQLDGGAGSVEVPRLALDGPCGEWAIDISFADPAALRATTATVAITVGLPLTGGEPFTIDHPTLGKRTYDVATAGPLTGGQQVITFRPPLREAVANEALEFQSLACVMRLANPEDFLGAMGVERTVEANAVWIESFDAA